MALQDSAQSHQGLSHAAVTFGVLHTSVKNFFLGMPSRSRTCRSIVNLSNLNTTFLKINKDSVFTNQFKDQKSLNLESKKLIIYPYSFSPNLLKEILLKTGLKFVLTNDIKKASLILGLKKHLKQNFKLISLAKQKNIPVYTLNQISLYQITKMIQLLK